MSKLRPGEVRQRVAELGLAPPHTSWEKEMATHSSILACKISWTEEPCGLQSTGSQRVGQDRATNTKTHTLFLNTLVHAHV